MVDRRAAFDKKRPMTGKTNLKDLFKTMEPVLADEVFVFVTLPTGLHRPNGLSPRMVFEEAEGTTFILSRAEASLHGLEFEFPCRMITLNVHSSLEAVGFIAVIATELAKRDMGVNPVSGFFHDHLFVPEDRAEDALVVLRQIISDAS